MADDTPTSSYGDNGPTGAEGIATERELIVVAQPQAELRTTREDVFPARGADVAPLEELLRSEGVSLRPLFGISEERLRAQTSSLATTTDADVPDLSVYYRVEAPDERLDELAERLRDQDVIEAAYVKPPAAPPSSLTRWPLGAKNPHTTPQTLPLAKST